MPSRRSKMCGPSSRSPECLGLAEALKQRHGAPGHAQQALEDVRAVIPQPRVHVLVGDVLPDVGHASRGRLRPAITAQQPSFLTLPLRQRSPWSCPAAHIVLRRAVSRSPKCMSFLVSCLQVCNVPPGGSVGMSLQCVAWLWGHSCS